MLTLKDLIKQAEEAANALVAAKRKVWSAFLKEVNEAKGRTANTKKKKVFETLTVKKQKACANPDKFVRNIVKKDRVLPQRPPKEPAQHPNDSNAVLAVRPPGLVKPDKETKDI